MRVIYDVGGCQGYLMWIIWCGLSMGYLVSRANLNLSYTLEDIKAVAPPPESLSRLLGKVEQSNT